MSEINPKMNNTAPEADRTINDVGFNGMSHHSVVATTEKATVPYSMPAPLMNMVNESADSQKIDVGPSAHDIVERGM